MAAAIDIGTELRVTDGINHLELKPGCKSIGKFIITFKGGTLHLWAKPVQMAPDEDIDKFAEQLNPLPHKQYMNMVAGTNQSVIEKLAALARYSSDLDKLGRHIDIPAGKGEKIIAGAFFYYDGNTLHIDGESSKFSEVTSLALDKCLENSNVPRHYGEQVEKGGSYFSKDFIFDRNNPDRIVGGSEENLS